MLSAFDQVRKNFKLKPKAYTIDNLAFKLHYRVTTLMLVVATVLVTSRQYIGEHIRCIGDSGVPAHVMNTFCFFTATFTVIKHLNSTLVDKEALAHPGVGPMGVNTDEPTKRHAYYQWVPFVLFGQALMFYFTHLLWKKLEGGRLRNLVDGLQFAAFALGDKELEINKNKIPSKQKRNDMIKEVRRAFMSRLYINRSWSISLVFCELINFFHVILQVHLTNKFLSGQFLSLGPEILRNGVDSSVDQLDVVFPKVTKCTFYKYGPSGSIQKHDAMCVMALNIINDKIYVMLWFWFLILFIISGLALIWRLITVILHARSQKFNELVFSTACPGKLNPWRVLRVTRYCNFTDWLFLYYLSKNMDGFVFRDLFIGLAEDLDDQTENPALFDIFVFFDAKTDFTNALQVAREMGDAVIKCLRVVDVVELDDHFGAKVVEKQIINLLTGEEIKDEVAFLFRKMDVMPADRRMSVMPEAASKATAAESSGESKKRCCFYRVDKVPYRLDQKEVLILMRLNKNKH
ncbi:hypothetical protein FQR65_LT04121 [Abscondita terminalis]|nr:hypothetical protein FQR65_LT04121 [Abscondita terminalis]